jgi:hypothetical protein
MDRETEKRRTINYLSDLLSKLTTVCAGDTKLFYDQVYSNFIDARQYLVSSPFDDGLKMKINNIPHLLKPNIFNRQLGSLWTLSILGFINPFVTLLILTASFPVSLPLLLIRTLIVRQTKQRLEGARIEINEILNKLMEKG